MPLQNCRIRSSFSSVIFGIARLQPFASSSAVSLVDVSPSTDIILYVSCYACTQCFLQKLLRNRRISRHKAEHRAHIRMDHAGTLAHAADRDGLSVLSSTSYRPLSFFTVSVVMIASAANVAGRLRPCQASAALFQCPHGSYRSESARRSRRSKPPAPVPA